MSRKKRESKVDKSFRVIPEYRNEVDVNKLCKVLIFAAQQFDLLILCLFPLGQHMCNGFRKEHLADAALCLWRF